MPPLRTAGWKRSRLAGLIPHCSTSQEFFGFGQRVFSRARYRNGLSAIPREREGSGGEGESTVTTGRWDATHTWSSRRQPDRAMISLSSRFVRVVLRQTDAAPATWSPPFARASARLPVGRTPRAPPREPLLLRGDAGNNTTARSLRDVPAGCVLTRAAVTAFARPTDPSQLVRVVVMPHDSAELGSSTTFSVIIIRRDMRRISVDRSFFEKITITDECAGAGFFEPGENRRSPSTLVKLIPIELSLYNVRSSTHVTMVINLLKSWRLHCLIVAQSKLTNRFSLGTIVYNKYSYPPII